jgi:hypothetical protein
MENRELHGNYYIKLRKLCPTYVAGYRYETRNLIPREELSESTRILKHGNMALKRISTSKRCVKRNGET